MYDKISSGTENFRLKTVVMALFILPLLMQPLACLAEDLPPAGEICDRFIEVTGGKEAYASIDNVKSVGKFEMTGQGIVMTVTSYTARPNLMYTLIESPQLGKMERGVSRNGIAWENNMMTGPSIKEGAEKEQMLTDAVFNRMANWRDVYASAENAGIAEVDGKKCYRIIFTTPGGETETSFFDRDSGLLVKVEKTIQSQMGEISSVAHIKDYRKTGSTLTSFETVVEVMGQKRKVTLDKVETNIELPEGIFELPDEIAALLEKKKPAETEEE